MYIVGCIIYCKVAGQIVAPMSQVVAMAKKMIPPPNLLSMFPRSDSLCRIDLVCRVGWIKGLIPHFFFIYSIQDEHVSNLCLARSPKAISRHSQTEELAMPAPWCQAAFGEMCGIHRRA